MPLIRRQRPGLRNIGNRLAWAKRHPVPPSDRVWAAFLRVLGSYYLPFVRPIRSQAQVEAALNELGHSPYEALIPWLWREFMRTYTAFQAHYMRDEALRRAAAVHTLGIGNLVGDLDGPHHQVGPGHRPLIDWYLGARPRPDIGRLTWADALAATEAWHAEMAAKAVLKALDIPAIETAFPHVLMHWKDGSTLRLLHDFSKRHPRQLRRGDPAPSQGDILRPLMAVGASLGHCYQEMDVAREYARGGIAVFFDPGLKPRFTLALQHGEEAHHRWAFGEHGFVYNVGAGEAWIAIETRGSQNAFPKSQWWSYLVDVFQPMDLTAKPGTWIFEHLPAQDYVVVHRDDQRVKDFCGHGRTFLDPPEGMNWLLRHADGWTEWHATEQEAIGEAWADSELVLVTAIGNAITEQRG